MLQYQNIYAGIIRYSTYSIKKNNIYEILNKYAYFSVRKILLRNRILLKNKSALREIFIFIMSLY